MAGGELLRGQGLADTDCALYPIPLTLPCVPVCSGQCTRGNKRSLQPLTRGPPCVCSYINLGHDADLPAKTVDVMRDRAHEVMDAAAALGVTYFDCARSYGKSEEFAASWLASRPGVAQRTIVGSKVTAPTLCWGRATSVSFFFLFGSPLGSYGKSEELVALYTSRGSKVKVFLACRGRPAHSSYHSSFWGCQPGYEHTANRQWMSQRSQDAHSIPCPPLLLLTPSSLPPSPMCSGAMNTLPTGKWTCPRAKRTRSRRTRSPSSVANYPRRRRCCRV
jgi:hypothetical protein